MENFDLVNFKKGSFAVQCTTFKSSRSFLSFLEENGIVWINTDNATSHNPWGIYEEICFSFEIDRNGIMYSDVDFCQQNNLPVVLL